MSLIIPLCLVPLSLQDAGIPDDCTPNWAPTFGAIPGFGESADPDPFSPLALAVFDDGQGNGPALYVGGNFTYSSCVERSYLVGIVDLDGDGLQDVVTAGWDKPTVTILLGRPPE